MPSGNSRLRRRTAPFGWRRRPAGGTAGGRKIAFYTVKKCGFIAPEALATPTDIANNDKKLFMVVCRVQVLLRTYHEKPIGRL